VPHFLQRGSRNRVLSLRAVSGINFGGAGFGPYRKDFLVLGGRGAGEHDSRFAKVCVSRFQYRPQWVLGRNSRCGPLTLLYL
jgi:hypothetical protein